jgi:hypothetical protein
VVDTNARGPLDLFQGQAEPLSRLAKPAADVSHCRASRESKTTGFG